MKKLLSTILAVSLIITATACSTSGADNRETVDNRETKSTVNPDISEPNQSIASGALIPDQTTETSESATSNSNTYTVRGKDFTLSVHLEDYIYTMDGTDYEYFNLEGLMSQYGYSHEDDWPYLCYNCVYGNSDLMVSFPYDSYSDGTNAKSNHAICGYIDIKYRSSYDGHLGVGCFTGAGNTDRLFEINGVPKDGKSISKWCLTWEQIVLLCVVLDDYAENGTTAAAKDSICKVFESGGGAGHGSAIRLN